VKQSKKPTPDVACMKSTEFDEMMRKALRVEHPDSAELTKAAKKRKARASRRRGKADRIGRI